MIVAAGVVGAAAALGGKRLFTRLIRGRVGETDEYNAAKVIVSELIRRDYRRRADERPRPTRSSSR